MSADDQIWEPQVLQHAILQHVNRATYRPVKPKVIAKKLGIPKERYQAFRAALKKLVKTGRLQYGGNHLVRPATADDQRVYVIGSFSRSARGFGFVRPAAKKDAEGQRQDIFIPARKTLDAANRDLVRVKLGRSREGGDRIRGEIVEIVERATRQFVGLYFERDGRSYVRPSGKTLTNPLPVGDPGAKNVREGDLVVVEMLHFPSPDDEGEGVIMESLGKRGDPGVDTLAIMREYGLPEHFSEEVLQAARVEADKFDEKIHGDRRDLSEAPIVTIDPKDARDFDDAISLEQLENGHWRLGVHIADVSHFVQPGTPLDEEAKQRGTSVYLPDRVVPMLPEIISNGLASLQPGRLRYAKSVFIEMTAEGARVDVRAESTAIKSKQRFTYQEIDQYLADPKPWKTRLDSSVCQLLDRMHQLAMTLRKRRLERGALELVLPEVKIEFDKQGRVSGAHKVENTESHQIIEEFMLAANEAVAELLQDRNVNLLRRIHEPPDPRKLLALTKFVRELGLPCESLESRYEIKRIIEAVRGQPEEQAVNFAVLKSMQKAVYSPEDEGHYALNSKHYCHFTSPIRRYPDLVVHRLLFDVMRGQTPDDAFVKLLALGDHCSDRERRAEEAERELVKLKLLTYLSRRVGKRYSALITGVERYGFFAQAIDLPAEGLVRVESLLDDHYYYDEDNHSISGHRAGNQFRLGDLVEVEVGQVDLDRRALDWVFVQHLKRPDGAQKKLADARSSSGRKPPVKQARRKGKRRR